MPLEVRKLPAVDLRSVGLNEKWLQEKIKGDPTLLGLGDLEIVSQEHRQPVGGRVDFLMRDSEMYYEVEVMLGALDESHIIRTIEYWDIERQRRPKVEHCAVIVAEEITSRFFNVIRLLNRSVPLIAIQLSAFKLSESEIVLHPLTVLNIDEEADIDTEVDIAERTDRAYWERRSSTDSLAVADRMAGIIREAGHDPTLTYNRGHIALGTTGYNFCWFHPRRTTTNCQTTCRVNSEIRDAMLEKLRQQNIEVSPLRHDRINFVVNMGQIDQHLPLLRELFGKAEDWSNR